MSHTTEEAEALGLCGICTIRQASEMCPRLESRGMGRMCRRCHAALRISYFCKCLGLDEARTIYDEETSMTEEKKDDRLLRTNKRELPVVLTQAELLAKGDTVASLHAKGAKLRVDKKTMTDEISGEIKGVEGAISVLVGQIRTRSERREVLCDEIADYDNDVVNVVRKDTLQVVEVRALLPHERQRPLPLKGIDGGKDAEPKPEGKGKARRAKKDEIAEAEETTV